MKIAAWTLTLLLTATAGAMAASPEALWQEYQKHPGYVATEPVKPTPREAPHVTVETKEGAVQHAPASQQEVVTKAEHAPASQQEVVTKAEPAPASQQKAAQPKAKQAAAANQPAAEQKQEAAQQAPAPQQKQAAAQPVVGTQPAAKRAPKPSLLPKRPVPHQYMRTPQAGDFAAATSERGGYSLQLPKAFGSDPLEQLPGAEGPMLVRSAGNTLLCAATVLDAADTASFKQQPLPEYKGKELYACWLQDADLEWTCTLSTHEDYYGSKLVLEATAQQQARTYQLLYVLPLQDFGMYLPQALSSLHSFKLLPAK